MSLTLQSELLGVGFRIDLPSLSLFPPLNSIIVSPERADRGTLHTLESVLFPSLSQTITWGVFPWERLSWRCSAWTSHVSLCLIYKRREISFPKYRPEHMSPVCQMLSRVPPLCHTASVQILGLLWGSSPQPLPSPDVVSNKYLQLDILNSWAVLKYVPRTVFPLPEASFPLPPGHVCLQTHSSFKKICFISLKYSWITYDMF